MFWQIKIYKRRGIVGTGSSDYLAQDINRLNNSSQGRNPEWEQLEAVMFMCKPESLLLLGEKKALVIVYSHSNLTECIPNE